MSRCVTTLNGHHEMSGTSTGAFAPGGFRRKAGLPEPEISGDHSGGVTPDPIPNSAVKPSSADGTARATVWESRSLPDLVQGESSDSPFFLSA
jgi:hypothetical protein